MHKFKIHDKVAAYIGGTIDQQYLRVVGVITEVKDDEVCILVDKDKSSQAQWWVHIKQCRKIKIKKSRSDTLFISEDLISWERYERVRTRE